MRAIGNRAIDFSYGIYVNGSVAISGGTVVATASSSAGRENHGIRLTAPYSEERREAARRYARESNVADRLQGCFMNDF